MPEHDDGNVKRMKLAPGVYLQTEHALVDGAPVLVVEHPYRAGDPIVWSDLEAAEMGEVCACDYVIDAANNPENGPEERDLFRAFLSQNPSGPQLPGEEDF